MKKILGITCMLLVLSGCSNTDKESTGKVEAKTAQENKEFYGEVATAYKNLKNLDSFEWTSTSKNNPGISCDNDGKAVIDTYDFTNTIIAKKNGNDFEYVNEWQMKGLGWGDVMHLEQLRNSQFEYFSRYDEKEEYVFDRVIDATKDNVYNAVESLTSDEIWSDYMNNISHYKITKEKKDGKTIITRKMDIDKASKIYFTTEESKTGQDLEGEKTCKVNTAAYTNSEDIFTIDKDGIIEKTEQVSEQEYDNHKNVATLETSFSKLNSIEKLPFKDTGLTK